MRSASSNVVCLPRRKRRTLPLLAMIAGLLAAMWAVYWYFFQLPLRATPAPLPAGPRALAPGGR